MVLLQTFIDWFVPNTLKHDPLSLSRGRNVTGIAWAVCLAGYYFAYKYYSMGVELGAIGIIVAATTALFAPLALRLTSWLALASTMMLLILSALLLWLMFVGMGVMASNLFWFGLIPVAAVFLGGWRSGIAWTIAAVVIVAGVYSLEVRGILLPLELVPAEETKSLQITSAAALIVLHCLLTLLFEKAKLDGFVQLDAARRDAEAMADNMAEILERV